MSGYWRSEVIGSDVAADRLWAVAEDRSRAVAALDAGETHPPFYTTLRRKDGTLVAVLVSIATAEVNDQPCEIIAALAVDSPGASH
jgi:hypothetical protein